MFQVSLTFRECDILLLIFTIYEKFGHQPFTMWTCSTDKLLRIFLKKLNMVLCWLSNRPIECLLISKRKYEYLAVIKSVGTWLLVQPLWSPPPISFSITKFPLTCMSRPLFLRLSPLINYLEWRSLSYV